MEGIVSRGRVVFVNIVALVKKDLCSANKLIDKFWNNEKFIERDEDTLKGKYGLLSFFLAIAGISLFYLSSQGSKGVFNPYFFTGFASWISSFVLGVKGVKTKESGSLKYVGMGMISLIVIGYGLIIIIIGTRGFGA